MAAVQERVAELRGLTRRYGDDGGRSGAGPAGGGVDAVLAWAATAAERLAELADDGSLGERLEGERTGLREALGTHAQALSAARTEAAERLGGLVGAELAELAMPHARLDAAVTQRDLAAAEPGDPTGPAGPAGLTLPDGRVVAFGRHGVDDVELLLSPHDGAPARPLSRGASGGELSRVMLALEVVLAGLGPGADLRVRRGGRRRRRPGRGRDRPPAGPARRRTPRSWWSPTCPRSRRTPTATSW